MRTNIVVWLLTFWLTGCNDFLAESSQDEIHPSTVADMEQILNKEVYLDPFDDYIFNITSLFTDEMQCNGLIEDNAENRVMLEKSRWAFGWQKDMFNAEGGGNDPNFWEVPYRKIKGCNVILDYIDKVTGDQKRKESLRGESFTMRGYYYLMLVNFFGQPYNSGNPEQNLGVPLKLSMDVTGEFFTRNTVAEVYRSIEKDLLEGNRLLEQYDIPKDFTHANHLAAKALLSRMYLYKEDWDKALEYADQVLKIKPKLLDLSKLSTFDDSESRSEGVYCTETPDEIIWARSENLMATFYRPPFSLSEEFINLFDSKEDPDDYGDLRYKLYTIWSADLDDVYFMNQISKDPIDGYSGIRTAEMYLNRAEAYIHKYIETGNNQFRINALADLNHLRECRYDTRNVAYQPVEITNATELFDFYKAERQRELCGENNHRWFDLRRYGMPELKHIYFIYPGEEQTFVLEKNSLRYILQIPEVARKANPKLEQNP